MKRFVLLLGLLVALSAGARPAFYEKQCDGFKVWLYYEQHGAVVLFYELDQDTGNQSRSGIEFTPDPSVPSVCQPTTGRSYRTPTVDPATGTWDRGHLVPANHMDGSQDSITDTFFVTNILPQQSTFNQSSGAWHETEIISECYRDISRLSIWGGVIRGEDTGNDFFADTHGVMTPDHWWKVIFRHDTGDYIAGLFPNHASTTAADIDDYRISLTDLKAALVVVPDFGPIEGTAAAGEKPGPWPVSQQGNNLTCEGHTTSRG